MTPTQFWFDSVYRSYHAYIRKAAFLIGVTHGVRSIEQWADDMTHNAFCSLLKSVMVHGIPEEDNIPGLLKGYLRNVVGNYFQKSANHESTFTEIGDAINNFPASSPIESISYPTGLSGDDRVLLHLHYSMDNETLLIVANELDRGDMRTTEVDAKADPYWVNDAVFYLMSDKGSEIAIWYNGDFECRIYGTVSRDELKQIVSNTNS